MPLIILASGSRIPDHRRVFLWKIVGISVVNHMPVETGAPVPSPVLSARLNVPAKLVRCSRVSTSIRLTMALKFYPQKISTDRRATGTPHPSDSQPEGATLLKK